MSIFDWLISSGCKITGLGTKLRSYGYDGDISGADCHMCLKHLSGLFSMQRGLSIAELKSELVAFYSASDTAALYLMGRDLSLCRDEVARLLVTRTLLRVLPNHCAVLRSGEGESPLIERIEDFHRRAGIKADLLTERDLARLLQVMELNLKSTESFP